MTTRTEPQGSLKLDRQLAHGMAHPVRVDSLSILSVRTASPKEISSELSCTLSVVSHHINELLKLGWIELVRMEPRRGALEHYYRAVIAPEFTTEEWALLTPEERQRFSLWTIQSIMGDVTKAFDTGTFDSRIERHLSRVPLYVDREGFDEIAEIQNRALEEILAAQATSTARMAAAGEEQEGLHASTAMYCIEQPEPRLPKVSPS